MKNLALFAFAIASVLPSGYALPAAAHAAQLAVPPIQVITLSNSVAPLEQGWRFEPGDSPWVSGAPLWAQPGYDDVHWAAMDLTPKAGAVDLTTGISGFVPGWTAKGYPNLSGYAWYRLRVRVNDPGQPLWLKMPSDFDDAFQLYANGHYMGEFGGFSGKHVTVYAELPVSFALPQPGPDGVLTLALRFYMSPASALINPDVGGMHGPAALGLASTVGLMEAAEKDARLHGEFGDLLIVLLNLLVAPLALWAWLYNRRARVWLWLFLAFSWYFLRYLEIVLTSLTTVLSFGTSQTVTAIFLPLMAIFWWHWFGLEEKRWIPRAAWLLAAASTLASLLEGSPFLGFSFVPQAALPWCNDLGIWFGVGVSLLEVVILTEGFRLDHIEALLPAIPILLGLFSQLSPYLLVDFHIPNNFFPFGVGIGIGDIVQFLTISVIFALALRRFMRTQVRESLARQVVKLDLEQAQQLQQRVLLPETIDSPSFTVETEYHPAQTVGGDFFQTIIDLNGTLLVVIGDVSGKGVSASMLVAVLVGAIRGQAEHSLDPQAMLAMLNRRMIGRSSGHFATCLVVEIAPGGAMRVANAGHLPPYLNGQEMEIEGSLPLGLSVDAEYTVQTVKLHPGDHLTFMTDGVVEATNGAKELFGFERARACSQQQAASIAQQAQSFGQEDDITVVQVAFAAA